MAMPFLPGLSNQGVNKTDKYSAKKYHLAIIVFLIKKIPVLFNHRRSYESRSIPPHLQGGVQAGRVWKAGRKSQ